MHEYEVFIPIFLFLVVGVITVTFIFFRSKEKQMMIERGLSYSEMVHFVRSKRDPYLWLKIGIVAIFFGLGLGTGIIIEESTHHNDAFIPLLLFTLTGTGIVVAYFAGRMLEKKDSVNDEKTLSE